MIDPEHEDLVQRAIDGAVSPEESARLRALLVRVPEAKVLDTRLQGTVSRLAGSSTPDPPPGFTATVMRQVEVAHAGLSTWQRWRRRARAKSLVKEEAGLSHAGSAGMSDPRPQTARIAPRTLAWGTAAVAGVAMAVGLYVGLGSVDRGTDATIGAARRGQPAPTTSDRRPASGDADRFLAGRVAAELSRDGNIRRLLREATFRQALSSEAFRVLLADATLPSDAFANRMFTDPLADPTVQAALASPSLRAVLSGPAFAAARGNAAFQSALQDPGFARALEAGAFAEGEGRR